MLLHHLSPASFRGVRFLVPSDTAEAGRNTIRHAYPDKSFHYLEDNGLHPDEFKILAILHGPTLPNQLRALVAALKRPGPGLLKHPYLGSQFVQVDGKYRLQRDDRDAGIIEIEIPFSVTGPARLPGAVSGIPAAVSGIASAALTSLFEAFSSRYGDPTTAASVNVVASSVADLGDEIDAQFASAGTAGAELSARAARFASDGPNLGTTLERAIRTPAFDDDTYSAEALVAGFGSVADVAASICDTAAAITPDTLDKARRQECLTLLGGYAQAGAFLGIVQGVVSRTYATADDVARDEERLTDLINALQERDLDASVHRALLEVYTAASEVLAEVAVRRPRLGSLTTQPIPASVLAYAMTESDEIAPTLVTLNLLQPPVLMTGEVTVLMER